MFGRALSPLGGFHPITCTLPKNGRRIQLQPVTTVMNVSPFGRICFNFRCDGQTGSSTSLPPKVIPNTPRTYRAQHHNIMVPTITITITIISHHANHEAQPHRRGNKYFSVHRGAGLSYCQHCNHRYPRKLARSA